MSTVQIQFKAERKWHDDFETTCPNCRKPIYGSKFDLDDAWACDWVCCHCQASTYVDHRSGPKFVLPFMEECVVNGLPAGSPTRGWMFKENEGKSREEIMAAMGWKEKQG
jgi:hypothetical protein